MRLFAWPSAISESPFVATPEGRASEINEKHPPATSTADAIRRIAGYDVATGACGLAVSPSDLGRRILASSSPSARRWAELGVRIRDASGRGEKRARLAVREPTSS
jgi:hypothetical protein